VYKPLYNNVIMNLTNATLHTSMGIILNNIFRTFVTIAAMRHSPTERNMNYHPHMATFVAPPLLECDVEICAFIYYRVHLSVYRYL